MLLLLSLFSFLFLVKNTFGVKEGRLCGGNCLFACAHVVAYGTKNPSGLKEGRKFWHSVAMWSFWNKQVLVIERVAWKIIQKHILPKRLVLKFFYLQSCQQLKK